MKAKDLLTYNDTDNFI